MTDPIVPSQLRQPRWLGWIDRAGSAVLLVCIATIVRMIWLIYFCEYTLIEDEAKYWVWSTRLDWSYYTKGPGVAWAIRAATELLGNAEWAVRTPAVVAGAVGALAIGALARDVFGDRRVSFVAVLLYLLVPSFAITGVLMTIDGPYLACWAVAAWTGYRAIVQGRGRWFVLLGVALAAGFLFKYTIVSLVPGLVIAAMICRSPERKRGGSFQSRAREHTRKAPSDSPAASHLPRRDGGGCDFEVAPKHSGHRMAFFIAGLAVALLGLLPVLIWNAQHGWVTIRHLLGHLGVAGGDTLQGTAALMPSGEPAFSILWPLTYLGLLVVMGGPVVPLSVIGKVFCKWQPAPTQWYLAACALPVIVFYFAVSFIAETEGNWPIAGFVTLVPLAAMTVIRGVQHNLWPVRFLWGAAIVMGVGAWLGFAGMATMARSGLLGDLVPIHRLTGMHAHAEAVRVRFEQLRDETGQEPFILCEHYGKASQLWYEFDGQPKTYCATALIGGRRDQWDIWQDTDLTNPAVHASLLGRPALIMGGRPDQWEWGFESFTDIGPLDAEPKPSRTTYIGLGYRGFEGWLPEHLRQEGQPIGPTP